MDSSQVNSERYFLPAAGLSWLLPLYDPMVKLMGGDTARKALLEDVSLGRNDRVLDIGCGTGTLAVAIKKKHPSATVIGLDPDLKAIARARRKAQRNRVEIEFDIGFGDRLPYGDGAFEHVFSSFMFHHLPAEEKANVLREVRRVLKLGAELHLVDFEGPDHRSHGLFAHFQCSNPRLADNSEERVVEFLKQAGFQQARKTGRRDMFMGGVAYYTARA